VVSLANQFRGRLTRLVANWVRVGFCQGNFNSDNCAAGGFTLDYGPFGFIDVFNPQYQSWTGGGQHYSFLNQPVAAQRNFDMFCAALQPLLASHQNYRQQLDEIQNGFSTVMQAHIEKMWAAKLGLETFDSALFNELETLMAQTPVDYTIFFRELSAVPDGISPLKKSFYRDLGEEIEQRWSHWLAAWKSQVGSNTTPQSRDELSSQMKRINPKYSLREWFVVPAYQQASKGNYALVRELQEVMTQPYAEQSKDVEEKYYRLKPTSFFALGGLSHYSCSS
jgi:uncharacterized protein YdiU (UPF0061 family)